MARMVLDVRVGETLVVDGLTINVVQKSGQLARLCLSSASPMDIRQIPDRRSIPREGEPGRRATDGK